MKELWLALCRGIALLWRHRWTFAVPVATFLLPATLYAVHLPDVYEAEATVHVRPLRSGSTDNALPRAPADRAEELMATVRDRILTRANLKAVLPIFDPGAPAGDVRALEAIAKTFDWEQMGPSTFTLATEQPDPDRASQGVNVLLETFLEGERADGLRQAESNLAFHERELDEAKKSYDDILTQIDAFRVEHEATLPDRKDAIDTERLRVQIEITAQAGVTAAARLRVQDLDGQLAALVTYTATPTVGVQMSAAEQMLGLQLAEEQRGLNALEKDLAQLRATKTEKYPAVIRLRSAIAEHERAVQETMAALDRERREARKRAEDTLEAQLGRRRQGLLSMRKAAEARLAGAVDATQTLEERMDVLHRHLLEIPATQTALAPLLREREQVAKRVEGRVQAAISAGRAVDFYRSEDLSDVTDFCVIAWAVPPVEVSGPRRWRYLLTAIALGLLAGYGILLLERRNEGATITAADDLAGLFPAAVVVGVPRLGPGRRRAWRARLSEVGLAGYVSVCLGVSVYFLAAHKGWVAMPDWLRGFFGGSA